MPGAWISRRACAGELRARPPRPPLFPRTGLLEQEHALLVRGDDVEDAVPIPVGDHELGADAALVVDLPGSEGHLARRVLASLQPVELRGLVRAGLILAVRPESLARDQVAQPVAV